jgi:sarcosine oxidase, subunit gamma
MTSNINRQSPMIDFADRQQPNTAGDIGLVITEKAFAGYFNIRIKATDSDSIDIIEQCLSMSLPTAANRMTEQDQDAIYWLGPDEWLLRQDVENSDVITECRTKLDGRHVAITDLSSAMTNLRFSGTHMEDVLRQGTTFDIHPQEFAVGSCAQTVFSHANVLIARPTDAADCIDMFVRRSFSDHVMTMLLDAAYDYGVELRR